jgi:hypothetical protein
VTSSKFRPVILRYNSKLQTISWRCNFMVTDGYNHVMWCPFCIDFNIIFGPRRSIELPGSIVRINWKPSGKIRSCGASWVMRWMEHKFGRKCGILKIMLFRKLVWIDVCVRWHI